VRFLPHILLLLAFGALGTGALEYLHNAEHRREDAREAAAAVAAGRPVKPQPLHDESNCDLHAQLHVPLLAAGWVPLLVCLGLFVAFLTLLAPPLVSQRPLLRLDCRGPPAC
jgi:hypothetical protein